MLTDLPCHTPCRTRSAEENGIGPSAYSGVDSPPCFGNSARIVFFQWQSRGGCVAGDATGLHLTCHRGIKIAIELKKSTPGDGKLKAFGAHLKEHANDENIQQLRREVEEFASAFPMPGL